MSNLIVKYDNIVIEPAPILNVRKEFIYNNDVIIGYKFVISLDGYGSSINNKLGLSTLSITNVIKSLQDIKTALMRNGKVLTVVCATTQEVVLTAVGGILRSFDIAESPNNLTQHTQFSATLDFNDVVFTNSYNTEVATDSTASVDTALNTYMNQLSSYNDNWNFAIAEEDMYRYYSRVVQTDPQVRSIEDYTTINVSYTITATGKHTFDSLGNTKPPWLRAKEFVQYKLYQQILNFRTYGPLATTNFSTTSSVGSDGGVYTSNNVNNYNTLNNSVSSTTINPTVYPILHNTVVSSYTIFNENISCNTAEGAGTFTATYSCILKFTDINFSWPQKSIHKFTVSYDQTRDFTSADRTITVNGTLEGLLATNILSQAVVDGQVALNTTGQTFYLPLPNNGNYIGIVAISPISKYTNALDDFVNYIGNTPAYNYNYYGSDDLSAAFKTVLSINYSTLFPNTLPTDLSNCVEGSVNLSSILALPQSFSVDHDYTGTVSYSASYSTTRSCQTERGFETLSITEKDPVPTYVEFIIPGRSGGPIIQDLNTNSHKRITLDFDGTTKKGCLVGTPFSDIQLNDFSGVCDIDQYVHFPPAVMCILQDTEANHPELIPESYHYDYNPIDGSFKLSKTYIICMTSEPCIA